MRRAAKSTGYAAHFLLNRQAMRTSLRSRGVRRSSSFVPLHMATDQRGDAHDRSLAGFFTDSPNPDAKHGFDQLRQFLGALSLGNGIGQYADYRALFRHHSCFRGSPLRDAGDPCSKRVERPSMDVNLEGDIRRWPLFGLDLSWSSNAPINRAGARVASPATRCPGSKASQQKLCGTRVQDQAASMPGAVAKQGNIETWR